MRTFIHMCLLVLLISAGSQAKTIKLESDLLALEIDDTTARWALLDKRSGARWPSEGMAGPGVAKLLEVDFVGIEAPNKNSVRLQNANGIAVIFALVDEGKTFELSYEGKAEGSVRVLGDALAITDIEGGYAIVPCREGLLIPVNSGKTFKRVFGTSDYEGCHMNMLGFIKGGSALIVTWDDAYVFGELKSTLPSDKPYRQKLTTTLELRRSARSIRLIPLGKGDWNTVAAGYRHYAEKKGLAITLREKIRRDPHVELLIGAANAKLWTCLARRMNEQSTKEESVKVRWTFDEAAKIAEHLRKDVGIEHCLFMMGGWTEGGYDCRHPDNLPANPECGGNDALASAVKRIQALGYVACLHDNVQDMYRDAKSWNPGFIEKRSDGSLITGGRWLGGRAYMVCAPKQLELAQRPQNLPAINRLFAPWSYFIDTTYAVGPRECYDPNHPIGRNDDIRWKIRLSDYAREIFGIFGSECGREWALPHSDFFEGLVAVSGRYYHNLKPEDFGATVIPFFEMVYHDCQICYGKYGYAADKAAEFVAHHVLCARPLYYHSFPDHLYWKSNTNQQKKQVPVPDVACYTRSDNGWAEGMHPLDVFLKNTYEVLAPLHGQTAHNILRKLEFLTKDFTLRQAVYGQGESATKIIVNFGTTDAQVESTLGGKVTLPPWGFVIEGPRFAAFHASFWNGQEYEKGALFTLRAMDEKNMKETKRIRVFHAFGPPALRWKGKIHKVQREKVIQS
ncbi:MAG: hypothetical protein GWN67_13390 [Phycisphaerae bacterium]|nr:hypothetical protein [Phycisphaerae bacterium]NIT57412.1 hypothetical protein [Fodinibius sp.]NIU57336.1 hypothetical protein [Phycisphaerae bacterium]NIV12328.1 hypothetical protein [Fodinibius sp.]NIW93769.1 hypothetical protein [Phycisphaerae bacterium]